MKKDIICAIEEAKAKRVKVKRALEILMLERSRYYDWIQGKDIKDISPKGA